MTTKNCQDVPSLSLIACAAPTAHGLEEDNMYPVRANQPPASHAVLLGTAMRRQAGPSSGTAVDKAGGALALGGSRSGGDRQTAYAPVSL